MTALGIMGGSFNPVHYGHLICAEYARVEYNLDKIIFVPAYLPPHKEHEKMENEKHRMCMVQLAVAGNAAFSISDLEIKRKGVSYTIDTIEFFLGKYPGVEIYFIMGMDSLLMFDTWKDAEKLAAMCKFIVATRPGYSLDEEQQKMARLPDQLWDNIRYLEIPGMDISSTAIRERLKERKTIKYLLPAGVEDYIIEKRLYLEEDIDAKR